MAYAQLEPFGPPAQFWQAGLIASMILNVNRSKASDKAIMPEDMMPRSMAQESEPESPEDVNARILQTFHDLAQMPEGTLKP